MRQEEAKHHNKMGKEKHQNSIKYNSTSILWKTKQNQINHHPHPHHQYHHHQPKQIAQQTSKLV